MSTPFPIGSRVMWNGGRSRMDAEAILLFYEDGDHARITFGGSAQLSVPVSDLYPYVSCEEKLQDALNLLSKKKRSDLEKRWSGEVVR